MGGDYREWCGYIAFLFLSPWHTAHTHTNTQTHTLTHSQPLAAHPLEAHSVVYICSLLSRRWAETTESGVPFLPSAHPRSVWGIVDCSPPHAIRRRLQSVSPLPPFTHIIPPSLYSSLTSGGNCFIFESSSFSQRPHPYPVPCVPFFSCAGGAGAGVCSVLVFPAVGYSLRVLVSAGQM